METISNKPHTSRARLSGVGTRVTGQRALILEVIQEGQGHLDASEIHRRARLKQPRLSLSTVYRTLQKFNNLGLVKAVHINDTIHHYEAKQIAEHHHLVCLGCGQVIEFSYPLTRQIKKTVPDAKGFNFVSIELRATGYCSQCRRPKK